MIRRLLVIAVASLLILHPLTTLAVSEDTHKAIDFNAPFWSNFDTCSSDQQVANAGEVLASLEKVPQVWRDLISAAAPDHPNSDARLVAAALWVENRGWPEYKTTGWSDSKDGAQGPWQFMPATWASMKVDGNGDGKMDPNDPADSVHGAFTHFDGSAGKPLAVTGYNSGATAEANYQTIVFEKPSKNPPYTNQLAYFGDYNGEGAPNGTKMVDFPKGSGFASAIQNSNYVKMGYWLLATDFQTGYEPETDTFIDAPSSVKKEGASGTASNIGSTNACSVNGAVGSVNTAGYAWPVAPQTKESNGTVPNLSAVPCRQTTCHHDLTPAFDLGRLPGGNDQVGTPVYALVDSEVTSVSDNYRGYAGCFSIYIRGNQQAGGGKEADNFFYANLHLQQPKVQKGQQIKAGTQIAVIGESKCTGNGSTPHLHIDRGCIINGVPQNAGRDACRDPNFVPFINSLWESLPEK